MNYRSRFSISMLLIITTACYFQLAHAKGISPYLPLKLAPEVESQIEKLMAMTSNAPLTKPYKAIDLLSRIEHIKSSHPTLYKRLSSYLKRYQDSAVLSHVSAELSISNNNDKTLPNQRGNTSKSNYQLAANGFVFANPYIYAALGARYAETLGIAHSNSHIAFGFEYAQIEIGYREHWFSPFHDGAMLVSTNAESEPSITISNATPMTSWNIRYELFYTALQQVDGIRLGDDVFLGRPRHSGIHVSFSPIESWTLGFNRTLQFGGGQRTVNIGDVLEALFDPAGKDNIDGTNSDDPNYEFGNQQASITSKVNVSIAGAPVSIYAEYGGEDTTNRSNFSLGNTTLSLGVYAPQVTDEVALRYEYSDWSSRWYVHHLYRQGYTNSGRVLGHWGADNRLFNDDTPADVHSLNLNWGVTENQLLDVTIRTLQNKNNTRFNYRRAYEIEADYSYATQAGFYGMSVYAGRDVFGDKFGKIGGYYRW